MNELRREMLTKEEINYMQNTDTLTLDLSTLNVKKKHYIVNYVLNLTTFLYTRLFTA